MIPFFSIITVTKNTEEKIDKTIKSILSQSYKNFEYIIIDGNSKDETFNKIRKYKNKKIKIFCRDDKNFYDGLNFAIKKAKGKYISVLNSGDYYYSNFILKKFIKIFLNLKITIFILVICFLLIRKIKLKENGFLRIFIII